MGYNRISNNNSATSIAGNGCHHPYYWIFEPKINSNWALSATKRYTKIKNKLFLKDTKKSASFCLVGPLIGWSWLFEGQIKYTYCVNYYLSSLYFAMQYYWLCCIILCLVMILFFFSMVPIPWWRTYYSYCLKHVGCCQLIDSLWNDNFYSGL